MEEASSTHNPRKNQSVNSDCSFGSSSIISTRSVTGTLARKKYNLKTQTVIEENGSKSVSIVDQPESDCKAKSPKAKKAKKLTKKGNVTTRKRAKDAQVQTDLLSTPSSSQPTGRKFQRLNFSEANWGLRKSSSDGSPTIYLSDWNDGGGEDSRDIPSTSGRKTDDNSSVESTNDFWCNPTKTPTVSDSNQKARPIDEKIFQYYQDVSTVVPADANKFDALSEGNSTAIAYILKMIVDNNLPMAVVDSWSLKEAFLFLQPSLNIPGSTTMTALLNRTVDIKLRPILQAEFDSTKHMCMIAGAWTNRSRQGILVVRVCYFGPDLEWKVRTISVKRIIGRHTKINLADMVYDDMVKWKLVGKIKHITTDAGANIKAAMEEIKDLGPYNSDPLEEFDYNEEPSNEMVTGTNKSVESLGVCCLSALLNGDDSEDNECDGLSTDLLDLKNDARFLHSSTSLTGDDKYPSEDSCTWTHCAAHNTQLVLSTTEKTSTDVKETVDRNNSLGRFCRREQVAADIKKKSGVMFQRAGKPRWSSNITGAVRLWNPLVKDSVNFMIGEERRLKTNDTQIPDPYTAEEYERLHEFILVLRPLQVLTDRLQRNGIVSPFVIPDILQCYLDIAAIRGLKYLHDVKDAILLELENRHSKYFKDVDFILATFLNPVCRLEFFKEFDCGYAEVTPICLNGTATDEKIKVWLHKLPIPSSAEVEALARKYLVSNGERRRAATCDANRSAEMSTISNEATRGNRLIKEILAQKSSRTTSNTCKTDVDLYLEMNIHPSTDLIAFWTSKYNYLPYLSRFIEFYFIKMPSCGTVETFFSILANINLPDSSEAKNLESRMLYKENMNIIAKVKPTTMIETEEKSLEDKVLKSIVKIRTQKIL